MAINQPDQIAISQCARQHQTCHALAGKTEGVCF